MAHSKLLLIHDVHSLGRSGDVVSVRSGYGRNYLLPQKLAVIADNQALKMQERLKEERLKKAATDKQESEQMAAAMEGLMVTTIVKVDHEGHMYGSVSAADIVHLVETHSGLKLEKSSIQLKHPLKEIGVFEIPVKLKEGVAAQVSVKITPEESDA